MCFTAKASVSAWWIMALIALFLWYRNENFDRALSIFVLTLGLIQLIEYGIHNNANGAQGGKALFITLWLQCLVLAIGVFIFIKVAVANGSSGQKFLELLAGLNLILFAVIFVLALIYTFFSSAQFTAVVGASGHIEWYRNGHALMGNVGILYLIGIFVPLFLIFWYYRFANIGIALLIIYGILSAAYVISTYPPEAFSSMWCYLAVGFAFLAWMIGIIPSSTAGSAVGTTTGTAIGCAVGCSAPPAPPAFTG